MQIAKTKTRSGTVEYAISGEGPPVVVVHGRSFGASWRNYRWMVPYFPDQTLITISRPGYSETPVESGQSFKAQGELIIDLLDSLEIDKAALIGISNGGPPVVEATLHSPERVNALILGCALAPHLVGEMEPAAHGKEIDAQNIQMEYETSIQVINQGLEDEELGRSLIALNLSEIEKRRLDENPAIIEYFREGARNTLDAPSGISGMRNDRIQTQFARSRKPHLLDVPLLVIHGDMDKTVRISHGEFYAGLTADSQFAIFDGAGHALFTTFRQEVMDRVTHFLAAEQR